MAARKAGSDQPEEQARRGHPLRAVALGGPDALHRRWPHRARQQYASNAQSARIALNRKNALFAGSDGGAEHWAVIASLIETCKLNDVDPLAYLTDVLTRIVNGHPQTATSTSCCRGPIRRARPQSRGLRTTLTVEPESRVINRMRIENDIERLRQEARIDLL